jgi:hypothetical protein
MTAKRATAKEEVIHGLTKSEACKILQVAPTADEELITQAYWHQAGKVRVLAAHDPEARKRLDELNRAFLVLNPARTEAPLSREAAPEQQAKPFAEDFFVSVRRVVDQTRRRWPEHVPEVATLSVTTAILTYLALEAGASPLWTLVAAGVAAVTILAPWRRL